MNTLYLLTADNAHPVLSPMYNVYKTFSFEYSYIGYSAKVFWSHYYRAIVVLTNFPEPDDLSDDPIEHNVDFILTAGRATHDYIDYLIDLSIEVNRPNKDSEIQRRIDLCNELLDHLGVGR